MKRNITDNESARMTTSKGTIQGYNGIATVDQKHQIIIDAQAFGAGQEQHTLKPVIQAIKVRYQRLGLSQDIFADNTILTADTGFACEDNMQYLKTHGINAYIPDNQFRSRDPKFQDQKEKYGKRHQNDKRQTPKTLSAVEFTFDPIKLSCHCPAGKSLRLKSQRLDQQGNLKVHFEGNLGQCR